MRSDDVSFNFILRIDISRLPIHGIPRAIGHGSFAYHKRNKTIGIARHGMRFRIDYGTASTVSNTHRNIHLCITNQLVRAVPDHRLVTYPVIMLRKQCRNTVYQNSNKKNYSLRHITSFISIVYLFIIPTITYFCYKKVTNKQFRKDTNIIVTLLVFKYFFHTRLLKEKPLQNAVAFQEYDIKQCFEGR